MKRKATIRFSGSGYWFIRTFSITLAVILMAAAAAFASAETLGFGFVNNTDVALRRGMNGKAVTRLPKDTCVWIRDTGKDSKGVLWYEVTAGIHTAGFAGDTPPDVSGWKEITDIGTGYDYCVGIRSDGRVVFAGDYTFMREGHIRK